MILANDCEAVISHFKQILLNCMIITWIKFTKNINSYHIDIVIFFTHKLPFLDAIYIYGWYVKILHTIILMHFANGSKAAICHFTAKSLQCIIAHVWVGFFYRKKKFKGDGCICEFL